MKQAELKSLLLYWKSIVVSGNMNCKGDIEVFTHSNGETQSYSDVLNLRKIFIFAF